MTMYIVTSSSSWIDTKGKVQTTTRVVGAFDDPRDAVEFVDFLSLDGVGQKDGDMEKNIDPDHPEWTYSEWTSDDGFRHRCMAHNVEIKIKMKEVY